MLYLLSSFISLFSSLISHDNFILRDGNVGVGLVVRRGVFGASGGNSSLAAFGS